MTWVSVSLKTIFQMMLGSWLTWTFLCAAGHFVVSFEQVKRNNYILSILCPSVLGTHYTSKAYIWSTHSETQAHSGAKSDIHLSKCYVIHKSFYVTELCGGYTIWEEVIHYHVFQRHPNHSLRRLYWTWGFARTGELGPGLGLDNKCHGVSMCPSVTKLISAAFLEQNKLFSI